MTQSPAGQGTAAPLSGDPGTTDKPRFAYGGQALMEGIYMRGKNAIGVAVRGPDGQIFAFFIMTLAAAEAAVGLAIVIALFRLRETTEVDELNLMKW